MSEKSFDVFAKEQSSTEKFDYFICTAAGALFAYIGQTYTPHKLDCWFYFITPIALLLLTACFGCGFTVITLINSVTRINRGYLQAHESTVNITSLLSQNQKTYTDTLGEPQSREYLEDLKRSKKSEMEEMIRLADSKMTKVRFLCSTRNILLALGFLLILASRILQPYIESK